MPTAGHIFYLKITSTSSTPTPPSSPPQRPSQRKPPSRAGKANAARGKRVRKAKEPAPRKPPGPYKPETPTEQILANLVKDPNVLPLLQHIVEYIFRTQLSLAPPPLPPVAPAIGTSVERPTKRRRLFRVPAGAEYWPQPFPFKEGEGPDHYRETWHMRHMIVLLKALVKGLRNQKRNNSQTILERKVFIPSAVKPVRRRKTALPRAASPSSATSPTIMQNPLIDDPAPNAQVTTTPQASDDALASPPPDLAIPPLPLPDDLNDTLDRLLALFAVSDAENAQGAPADQQLDLNLNVDALTGTNNISQLFYTTDASAGPQLFEWDRWIDSSNTLPSQVSETASTSNSGTGSLATPEFSWSGQNAELSAMMDIDSTVGATLGCDKTMDIIRDPDVQQLLHAEAVQPETTAFLPPFAASPMLDAGPLNQMLDPLAAFINSIPTATPTELQYSPVHSTIMMEVDHPASPLFSSSEATLQIPVIAPQPQPKSIPSPWSSVPSAISVSDSTLARRAQILQRAKALRAQLEKELEDTKLHRWQTLMEHCVLSAVLVRGGKEFAARESEAKAAKGCKRK